MGNYSSCCTFGYSNSKIAKLFDAHGQTQLLKPPVKAAELMLEQPGHVIAPVDELRRTRCVAAMRADDELLAGKMYLLVPLSRVNCRVSELEMAIIQSACEKRWFKRTSAKVLSASTEGLAEKEENSLQVLEEKDTGFLGHQLGKYRQWNPVLEPISEEF